MKRITILALVAAVPVAALAAAETYVIDGKHTLPRFEYSHFGYSTQLSRFDKTTGTITLDRAAKTGAVEVVIDATSVDTGYALFNGHLQSENFFDTAKHPTITFKSSRMKFEGDRLVAVEGDLTIKGIMRPLTLTVTSFQCMPHPVVKRDACGANATARIRRSDFNLGKFAPAVSDEVTLTIPVEAIRQ